MSDIRCICAIGLSGQLGLGGQLPWEGDRRPEFRADVERFFDITRGHVLIAGPKTIGAVPAFAAAEMTLRAARSHERPEDVLAEYSNRVVFIGGGPALWDVYAKYIMHWDITRLPYDGPADRWFDPKWLLTGKGRPL